jgi:hypothetical protein
MVSVLPIIAMIKCWSLNPGRAHQPSTHFFLVFGRQIWGVRFWLGKNRSQKRFRTNRDHYLCGGRYVPAGRTRREYTTYSQRGRLGPRKIHLCTLTLPCIILILRSPLNFPANITDPNEHESSDLWRWDFPCTMWSTLVQCQNPLLISFVLGKGGGRLAIMLLVLLEFHKILRLLLHILKLPAKLI